MNFEDEIEHIKNLLKLYIDNAKIEYSELANKREHKYTFTKENGKKLLGSHPRAIEHHIEELQDSVYSADKEQIAEKIIEDSNIQDEYRQAINELSPQGRQRLLDEVIKAEIELLTYDKNRNEIRTNPEKLHNTYIDNNLRSSNAMAFEHSPQIQLAQIKESIMAAKDQEEQKYKKKTKEEVFNEYFEEIKEQKSNSLDKIVQPIETLMQSAEHKYLVDYTIQDFEIFFDAMIYTPTYLYKRSKFYKDYQGNYVAIAEDFKESLESGENLVSDYVESEKLASRLQGIKNVEEKLTEIHNFLDYCYTNDYIKKNYLRGNKKFSKKKFAGILKGIRKRKPFDEDELNLMFAKLTEYTIQNGFHAEQIFIPLIGLYSGMRVEEICKLQTDDIQKDKKTGVWYFDINGKVKTESSVRKVPIHSQLIEKFNFLSYVGLRQNAEEKMLFDLQPVFHKGHEKYSHYFLRDFFSPFRDSFVSEERAEENLISFHSFRHTFATRLDAGRVALFDIAKLLGHSIDSLLENIFRIKLKPVETTRYTHEGELKNLYEDVEKLKLSDIQESIDSFEMTFKRFFSAA